MGIEWGWDEGSRTRQHRVLLLFLALAFAFLLGYFTGGSENSDPPTTTHVTATP